MKKFIMENWFKGGILLLVLIMACSVSYYYLIFIPQQDKAVLQQQVSAQNEAQAQQAAQQQQVQSEAAAQAATQAQAAAAKDQQLKNCIDNAHQVFLDAGLKECESLGYTQAQINDLQCNLPDNQALVKQQSDAEALCATIYK
jgi:hypothetical protein